MSAVPLVWEEPRVISTSVALFSSVHHAACWRIYSYRALECLKEAGREKRETEGASRWEFMRHRQAAWESCHPRGQKEREDHSQVTRGWAASQNPLLIGSPMPSSLAVPGAKFAIGSERTHGRMTSHLSKSLDLTLAVLSADSVCYPWRYK